MVQQRSLFDDENKVEIPKRARPRVTTFRLDELLEQEKHPQPENPILTLKEGKWPNPLILLEKIGESVRGTWAAPILGLLFYTLLLGCGIIAVFYLIGGIFSAAGFIIGGAINLAFNHPTLLFIILCAVGGVYLLISSAKQEKPTEIKPVVEDNTGLFD